MGENIISVDKDSRTISILLDLLKYGKSQSCNKEVILAVVEAGESLGIEMENISYFLNNKVDEEKCEDVTNNPYNILDHEENCQDTTEKLNTEYNLSLFDNILKEPSVLFQRKPLSRNENESTTMTEKLEDIGYDCKTCGNTYPTRKELSRHVLCHTSFRCNVSKEGFKKHSLLERHWELGHEENLDMYFTSENATLTEDTNETDESQNDDTKTESSNDIMSKLNFECNTCGKTFKSKLKLTRHSMCHTNFKCSICFKGFRISSLLQRHMSTMHMSTIQLSFV